MLIKIDYNIYIYIYIGRRKKGRFFPKNIIFLRILSCKFQAILQGHYPKTIFNDKLLPLATSRVLIFAYISVRNET